MHGCNETPVRRGNVKQKCENIETSEPSKCKLGVGPSLHHVCELRLPIFALLAPDAPLNRCCGSRLQLPPGYIQRGPCLQCRRQAMQLRRYAYCNPCWHHQHYRTLLPTYSSFSLYLVHFRSKSTGQTLDLEDH